MAEGSVTGCAQRPATKTNETDADPKPMARDSSRRNLLIVTTNWVAGHGRAGASRSLPGRVGLSDARGLRAQSLPAWRRQRARHALEIVHDLDDATHAAVGLPAVRR